MRFDGLMQREKKAEKTFGLRVGKVLLMRLELPEKGAANEDFLKAKSADTTVPLETRQLALLMARILNAEVARGKAKPKAESDEERGLQGVTADPFRVANPAPPTTEAEVKDWGRGIATVAELLQNAGLPDPQLAQAILAQAEALLTCAESFRTKSLERNRIPKCCWPSLVPIQAWGWSGPWRWRFAARWWIWSSFAKVKSPICRRRAWPQASMPICCV